MQVGAPINISSILGGKDTSCHFYVIFLTKYVINHEEVIYQSMGNHLTLLDFGKYLPKSLPLQLWRSKYWSVLTLETPIHKHFKSLIHLVLVKFLTLAINISRNF